MAEALKNEVANASTNGQRQNVPTPVKMVAAVYLLFAVLNLFYSFHFFSMAHIFGPLALVKVLLSSAIVFGLLNLRNGWRFFALITTGLGLLFLPIYFLAIFFSSDFTRFVSGLSGIDSWVVKLMPVVAFAQFLVMFIILMLPDVKRTFAMRSGRMEFLTC